MAAEYEVGAFKKMTRYNGSIIIYAILTVLLVTLLYFSWSLSTEVKRFKAEKNSLQTELSHNERESSKFRNQVQSLNDELQKANKHKSVQENEKEKLTTELSDVKGSLVRGVVLINNHYL